MSTTPSSARQLLAEAGYPNGFRTQLYAPSGRYLKDIEVAEAIQAQLAEVGIIADIVTMEWATYLDVTGQRAEDNPAPMIMLGWGTVTGDADYGLYPLFHTDQWVPGLFSLVLQQPVGGRLAEVGSLQSESERAPGHVPRGDGDDYARRSWSVPATRKCS